MQTVSGSRENAVTLKMLGGVSVLRVLPTALTCAGEFLGAQKYHTCMEKQAEYHFCIPLQGIFIRASFPRRLCRRRLYFDRFQAKDLGWVGIVCSCYL